MSELTFQDAILRLVEYWKELGCVVRNPYNVQVGAGTMNPETVLRVLGPEPWNVVYVEPSVRPDDGRFGDNPNRLQMHHQLQVILQPDPGNPQELFLKSLEAIGINPREHDIRFVEDNWESPALGAWGLGWEVWLDGQEITQFTYFQQAGSTNLDPVAVEITYGLDRIILALQNKDSVYDIDYNDRIAYGEIFLNGEKQHSAYYFDVADVDMLRDVYDKYEAESQRCIEAELVFPAHDFNLKCSHIFNVMDTRGAIGVTERANYFKRMRKMARLISELYIKQRHEADYPLLDEAWVLAGQESMAIPTITHSQQSGPQTFVLEIGQEELPAHDVGRVINQLKNSVPALLDELRLTHDGIEVDGTPRRIAVIVQGLAERQSDLSSVARGPSVDRAYDSYGEPTKAAAGFARGKGINVGDLRQVDGYVVADVKEIGRDTPTVLAEALPKLIAGIKFGKSMRWNESNIAYSRPLRWLVALFGANEIDFEYALVNAGRVSRGIRPLGSPAITIQHADHYDDLLRQNGIILRVAERQAAIVAASEKLAVELGGTIPDDADLLAEVTNLVESPTPFVGSFEEKYLELPSEVLVAVMRKHQRYFPVYRADGSLINSFVAVRNGDSEHLDKVRHGNEQVVRARFSDAVFFYGNDKDKQIEELIPGLETITFQAKLGSMKDKQDRLEKLTPVVADALGLSADDKATAARAAQLAKADLASNMVVEMTKLQGVMGGQYARLSGESEGVAAAIAEQYKGVSQTQPGLALALADRLDSLVGLTAAGLLPKGSNDPFALRRAAIQMIENAVANGVSVDLRQLTQAAADNQPIPVDANTLAKVNDFITSRLEVILRERGHKASAVKAVLGAQAHDPYRASQTVGDLEAAVSADGWEQLLDAYARCVRITRKEKEVFSVSVNQLVSEEGKALYAAYSDVAAQSDGTVATLVAQIRALQPAITAFFDNVLVMDKDETVRQNRLGLLQAIAGLADGIADLSELEGF